MLEDDEYKDRSPAVVLLTAGQPPARSWRVEKEEEADKTGKLSVHVSWERRIKEEEIK